MRPRAWHLICWGLLSVVVAAWLALVEVLWLPLRVGGVLVPLSVAAAALGTPLLAGLAHRMSGSRVVAVLPALTWVAIAVPASIPRREGDLLIVGTGSLGAVGLAFLLTGLVSAAVAVGRVLAAPRPARRKPRPAEARPTAVR